MPSDVFQLIREDGSVLKKNDPGLGPEKLVGLYRGMVMTRAFDERALRLQRSGRIGFYVPGIGQEAASVGAASALESEDWIVPSYRDLGMAIERGMDLTTLMAQNFASSADLSKGRQMPVHYSYSSIRFVSISSPIGTQIIHAAGIGMAIKTRGDNAVVLVSFGDGATSSNDFHTGMNFAGVFDAPVIFYCQNNHWAISLPRSQQTASETLSQKASAYGFEGRSVDGNDVLAVHVAVREAAEKARSGGGPTFIEALTYRMGPHSSSDDPTRYRENKEVEAWARRDPLDKLRKHLIKAGHWDEAQDEALYEKTKTEVQAAAREAEKAPPPDLDTLFDDVYDELPPHLIQQRADLIEEKNRRGEFSEGDGEFPL